MSYRNPKQFIDTQSGQHYRNLIKSVVKTGDDLAKDIIKKNAEVAERNNKIITGAEKKEQQILGRFGDVTAGNPAFNFGEGFEYYINQYSDLNIAVDTGKSENPVAARKRMAEIEQLPVTAKEGLAGLIEMTEALIEKADRRGQMGGLDLSSMVDPKEGTSDLEALLIMADQLRGNRSFNVVEENGKLIPAYTLGDRTMTYTQIQNYLAGPESGGVFNSIPDETKSYTEAAKLAMVPDPNDPQEQILNPKYYENQPDQTRVDGKGNTIVFKQINTEMLKNEPIGQTLKADGASLSNTDKISFYNNILATDNQFEYGKLLNKEEEEKFINAYVNYGLKNYVQQQHQVGFIEAPKEPTVTQVEYQEKLESLEERIQASDLFSLEETIALAKGLGIKSLDEVFESDDEDAKLDTIKVGGREITKDMTPAQKKKIILMGLGIKEEDADRISQKKENTQFDSPTSRYKGISL